MSELFTDFLGDSARPAPFSAADKRPWNGARMSPGLEFKIKNLPDSPGCYLMKSEGEIIYVGKAKNLKNRVSQYFHYSAQHSPKVRAMVEKIDDFDIMLVDTELEDEACRAIYESMKLTMKLTDRYREGTADA